MAVEVEIIIVALRRLPFEMCNCNLLLPGVPLLKAKVHASADDNLGGLPLQSVLAAPISKHRLQPTKTVS